MVKIPELKDKQLVAQIHKYDRILKSLLKDRKRRISEGAKPSSLMTPKERLIAKKMKDKGMIKDDIQLEESNEKSNEDDNNTSDQIDGLSLDSELLNVQEKAESERDSFDEDEEEEEEEVRVTQLLQLSQDQIQEFKEKSKAASKKKKKKKKGLFGL